MNQKNNISNLNVNDLKVIWRIFARNWYIPVVFILVLYVIGYFYIYKLTNVYQASVELLKSNDTYYKENLITDNNSSFYGGTQSFIDNSNEMRIIKSYDLMKETIDKLKNRLQVSYFIIGRVRTTEQFSGNPFKVNVKNINPRLNEMLINFRIIDYNRFQLKYSLNGEDKLKVGKFGEDCIDIDFNFLIERDGNFNRNTLGQLSQIEYQFNVHDLNNLVYNKNMHV